MKLTKLLHTSQIRAAAMLFFADSRKLKMYDDGAGVNGKNFRTNFIKILWSVLQVETQDTDGQTDTDTVGVIT